MKPVFRSKRRSFSSLAPFLFGLCCLAALLTAGPVFATTYHVRTGGTGDGLSWQTASSDLAGILASAVSGDSIWVAEGAYRPTEDSADRYASFVLKTGVALYGGFSGVETERDERNPSEHVTVLTGDIDDNDSVDQYGIVVSADLIVASNSYHVVYAENVDETAVLDGFVVTGGKADGSYPHSYGGGMCNRNSSPTVTNCILSGNSADDNGGGMSNYNENPTVANCTFNGNKAGADGGGMYNSRSTPQLTNCLFWDDADSDEIEGDTATLVRCLIRSGDVAVLYETSESPVASGDLALQPLADNGGPTMTCALGAASIAVDAGVASLDIVGDTPDLGNIVPSADQRGVGRPQGNGYDIGAYEVECYTVTVSADVGGTISVEPYGIILSGETTLVSKDFMPFSTPTFVITPEDSMDLTGVWLDGGPVSFDTLGATVTLDPISTDHTMEVAFSIATSSDSGCNALSVSGIALLMLPLLILLKKR